MSSRSMKTPVGGLALLSLGLYAARAVTGGISVNDRLNAMVDGRVVDLVDDENAATPILVQTTLIVSMIGVASAFAGMLHVKEWNHASRLVGIGVGVIACMLDMLVMGYAAKQWEIDRRDDVVSGLSGRSQFIGIAAAVQVPLQIMYIASIFKAHVEDATTPEPRFMEKEEEMMEASQEVMSEQPIAKPSLADLEVSANVEAPADAEVAC